MFGKKYFALGVLAAIFASSAPAVAQRANSCAMVGNRVYYINANGFQGTLKTGVATPISPGYKFKAQLSMRGEPTDQIIDGRCVGRKVTFTRKRNGQWTQKYTGYIFSQGSLSMAGIFSHNGTPEYGWYAKQQ